MIRPVIGISTYREPADWGQWRGVPATLLPARYAAAVSAGGATPVLLPPMGVADDVPGMVQRLDGLGHEGGTRVGIGVRHGGHSNVHRERRGTRFLWTAGCVLALSNTQRVIPNGTPEGPGSRRPFDFEVPRVASAPLGMTSRVRG